LGPDEKLKISELLQIRTHRPSAGGCKNEEESAREISQRLAGHLVEFFSSQSKESKSVESTLLRRLQCQIKEEQM
jgi:hypothetical protein